MGKLADRTGFELSVRSALSSEVPGDKEQAKVVASPRNHLDRTGRLLGERGLFGVQSQLHHAHDLAHDLHLQPVLGAVQDHLLDQTAQDAQRLVAQRRVLRLIDGLRRPSLGQAERRKPAMMEGAVCPEGEDSDRIRLSMTRMPGPT